jgi:hypothetical protein
MPSKSRHRRDKHSTRSKKGENRQDFSASGAQQQATAQNYEPVSSAPTPSVKVLTPRPKLTPVQHPYIAIELRRIAILTGIMLAVLVVLSLVIP